MGSFYGNITNTSKTQFQFDKIYPNRYEMERQKSTDGIYAGRYVLVEYDSDYQQDDFYRVWIFENKLYNTKVEEHDVNYMIRLGTTEASNADKKMTSVPVGTIIFTADAKTSAESGYQYTNIKYYQITDEKFADGHAGFKEVANGLDSPNYTINYNIDVSTYGAGRGYDSTVWQKAYIDGYEKYIMIAELNSVVPTFDVSADAPTMDPLIPHFDTQSTDIYYKLHWQPSWGFRVTEGETDSRKTESEDNNAGNYPSDIEVSYNKNKYDASTGKNTITKISYPGAIFFNKDGLDEATHNEYDGEFKNTNEISIQPTGLSGNKYNTHDGSLNVEKAPDIQEIKVLLPALGNILCNVWDKVYGYDPNNKNQRYRDLEWKDAIIKNENGELEKFKGLASPDREPKWEKRELGGKSYSLETIAGCINLAHDLLGMILTTKDTIPNKDSYNLNKIFLKDNKYYRIHQYPIYDDIDTSNIIGLNPDDYASDQEYNKAFENAVNEIIKGRENEDWYLIMDDDQSANSNRIVKRFNKKALTAAALNGHKLAIRGKDASGGLKYGYEFVELKGFANDLSTINGLILELRGLIESDDSETRDRETVQGTINTLNDIINIFEDLVPGEFLICDANGHVNSANWTTEQSFGYDNLGDPTKSKKAPIKSETNTDEEKEQIKENQWIELSVDESADDKQIKLIHKLAENHKQDNTITTSNKNDLSEGNGINKAVDKNKISLYTPIVDNAGHVVGKNTETVTLPYGYKFLETNGISNNEQSDLHTTFDESGEENKPIKVSQEVAANANTTQDKITINTGNKWIQTKIKEANDNDTVTIAHEIHKIDKTEQKTNNNGEIDSDGNIVISQDSKNNIVAYDVEVDAAGHVIKNQKHTYTLPYGFKTIKTNGRATNNNTEELNEQNDVVADNTQDDLIINSGNEWIKITTNADTDTIIISHDVKKTTSSNKELSLSDENKSISFSIPVDTYDDTNHYSSRVTTTYVLPNNYGKIEADNTITNVDGTKENVSEASSSHDTLSLIGDNWIKTIVSSDKVSFTHKAPQNNGTTTVDSTVKKPTLGGSFSVPKVSYDTNGHIYNATSYDITLPSLELSGTKEKDDNVMTNFTYTKNGTEMVATFGKIGDLALTGYSPKAENNNYIQVSDSINNAFGKLETRIDNEVTDRNTAITNAIQALDDYNDNTFKNNQTISSWTINDKGQAVIGVTNIQIASSQVTDLNENLGNIKAELLGTKPDNITGGQPTLYSLLIEIKGLKAEIERLKNNNSGT